MNNAFHCLQSFNSIMQAILTSVRAVYVFAHYLLVLEFEECAYLLYRHKHCYILYERRCLPSWTLERTMSNWLISCGTRMYTCTYKFTRTVLQMYQAIYLLVTHATLLVTSLKLVILLFLYSMQPDWRSRPPPESLPMQVWIAGVSAATEKARLAVVAQWLARASSSLGTTSEGQ